MAKKFENENKKEIIKSIALSSLNLFTNKFVTNFAIVGLLFISEFFLGENQRLLNLDGLSIYLTIPIAFLITEFLRYWVHRAQHAIPFLWKFHSVHHSVVDLNILNLYRSHPIDYFLRNIIPPAFVYALGFSPLVIFYVTGLAMIGALSHSGADLRNGLWNRFFSTNEVHRWHHATKYKGAGYNFGVVLTLWDQIFGTYYINREAESDLKLGLKE